MEQCAKVLKKITEGHARKTTRENRVDVVDMQNGRGFIGYPKGRNRDITLVN